MAASRTSRQSRRQFLQATFGMGFGVTAFPAPAIGMPILPELTGERRTSELKLATLAAIRSATDLSIRNIAYDGLDDIFPRPNEVNLLDTDPDIRSDLFSSTVEWLAGGCVDHPVLPTAWTLVPRRRRGDFRICVQFDPVDATRYLASSILVARVLESKRAPTNRVFSYRFNPQGAHIFDPRFTAESFQSEVLAKLRHDHPTHLVSADIANFYPSITTDGLSRALRRYGIEPALAEGLIAMLRAWAHPAGGIPIGPNASHILAEAVLMSVDEDLLREKVDFIRFADDYRLFAPDSATAEAWLALLGRRLAAEGLFLNAHKTSLGSVLRSEYAVRLSAHDLKFLATGGTSQTPPPPPPCPSGRRRCRPRRLERDHLDVVDTHRLMAILEDSDHVELQDFRLLIEACLHQSEFDLVKRLPVLSKRSPHCLPYLTEFLVQEQTRIPSAVRISLADAYGKYLNSGQPLPDYEMVHLAHLLGSEAYQNREALVAYLRINQRRAAPIVARYLVEALGEQVSKSMALRLLEGIENVEPWGRRIILRLALPHLDRQRRAALHIHDEGHRNSNPFLRAIWRDPSGRKDKKGCVRIREV